MSYKESIKLVLVGTLGGKGGNQTYLKWLLKALDEENIQTLAISLNPIDNYLFSFYQNIQLACVDSYQYRQVYQKIIPALKIKKLISGFSPDIYLGTGLGWNITTPLIFSKTPATRIFHETGPSNWRDIKRWAVRLFFNEVAAQSPMIAQRFAENFGWRKPISVLPAFSDPIEITAHLPNVRSRIVPIGKARAAFFSRLAPHKQAFWLVQQWDLLKDFLEELHIHGSGQEEPLIRDYIEGKGIGNRVKCFGRYPEGQAYVDLLGSYDLTLLPTIGPEGVPLVLLESMACGVPFVTYGVGGIPDYGINNPNVLIVKPEPCIIDRGKKYSTSVSLDEESAFVKGIKQMTHKLAQGEIDQAQLQQFYLEHYSYAVLKQLWISYFRNQL